VTRPPLLTAFLFSFALVCFASDPAQATGVLQGHLKIFSMETAKPADGSAQSVTRQTYQEYPLVVLSQNGNQQVAMITADAQGNFRANLAPGTYVLDIQNRVRKHARAKPVTFTVVSGQSVHVDIEMDTGIR
jgi:hypothetical protein